MLRQGVLVHVLSSQRKRIRWYASVLVYCSFFNRACNAYAISEKPAEQREYNRLPVKMAYKVPTSLHMRGKQ
jgi:hypothetical protein